MANDGAEAPRLAATSNVDANACVAVAGQIGMSQRVSLVSPVALTGWEILQDRGNKNRQPLLSVNDSSCNHGTVQCDPTHARQIDIPVTLPDSEP